MLVSRALRRAVCRVLIGLLLMTQFMVVSYACPPVPVPSSAAAAMPPGCDEVDSAAPLLCTEHCRQGQQGFDSSPALTLPPAVPTLLYALPGELLRTADSGHLGPVLRTSVAPEHPPPHAILHCVFRI